MKTPSFIAIGPPKTGTTWLYEMLKKHPQVALTPVKELNYFWEKEFVGDGGLLNFFNPFAKFKKSRRSVIKKGWLAERLKAHYQNMLKGKINWSDLIWDFRYFVLPHTDNWYTGLFDAAKVSGDISPMYALLPDHQIEALKKINPDAKIIISLRDPVERQWSRIRMKIKLLSRQKIASRNLYQTQMVESLIEDKENKHNISSYDYADIVTRWSAQFPKENIFIFFYEELLKDPCKVLADVCGFLNIDAIDIGKNAEEKVNKGIELDLPRNYLHRLISINMPYLEKMPAYFTKEYPTQWLEKYQRILSDSNDIKIIESVSVNRDKPDALEIYKN